MQLYIIVYDYVHLRLRCLGKVICHFRAITAKQSLVVATVALGIGFAKKLSSKYLTTFCWLNENCVFTASRVFKTTVARMKLSGGNILEAFHLGPCDSRTEKMVKHFLPQIMGILVVKGRSRTWEKYLWEKKPTIKMI